MEKFRKSKGQELVEFALILPVMLVILVAIAEMGFMWTLRGTVSDAVKSSVQQMQLIAGMDEATAAGTLQTNIQTYLANHGVPNASSVNVSLNTVGDNTTVNVVYTYNPTFTLPNFFGIQLLPDSINMGSSQVINSAIFGPNDYASGDTSVPALVNPASPSSVLVSDPTGETRARMAFLIDLPGDADKIVNWWGHDIMTSNSGVNAATGEISVKQAGGGWADQGTSYADLLLANGYSTVVYVDGSAGLNIDNLGLAAPPNIYDSELGTLTWCMPASAGGADECGGDITATADTSLLAQSIYDIGKGYEVLPPVPSASPADQVSLPSGDLVSDKTFRNVSYSDPNLEKLRFYVPKSVGAAFQAPVEGGGLANPDAVMEQTIDIDGDGIPNAFDVDAGGNDASTDADVDKNMIIDSLQTVALGATTDKYTANGWAMPGFDGAVPTYGAVDNTIDTGVVASSITPGMYLSPAKAEFADATCALTGNNAASRCNATRAFFLRVINEYTSPSGQTIRMAQNGGNVSIHTTGEKYKAPDPNRKVFEVEVISRDFDKDGVIELATGMVISVDDDGNADGKNDASPNDTWPYGTITDYTRGLMFVEGSTGRLNFNISDTLNGYNSVDPSSELDYPMGTKYP